MKRVRLAVLGVLVIVLSLLLVSSAAAWTPVPIANDPHPRMPGTQPGVVSPGGAANCSCHFNYHATQPPIEIGHTWQGSLMSQASRDPLFLASLVVAAQDSIWATGNPNAADLCLRCHFPTGWLAGRSDSASVNGGTLASRFTGADWEGVSCDMCHRMYDPFFEATYAGTTREGTSPEGAYWDEATSASHTALGTTRLFDRADATGIRNFNGSFFYDLGYMPPSTYTEAASGQFFVSGTIQRASFSDANPGGAHGAVYSRFHKSRYYCGTCHDISNPTLANLGANPANPLPTEIQPAYAYFHAERTFSEFSLSAYGRPGGATGLGFFAPATYNTSQPGEKIAACQDCHMHDVAGEAAGGVTAILRPTGSTEHPNSGLPLHDMTGGGDWVANILASTIPPPAGFGYDPINAQLLGQVPLAITLDLTQGMPLNYTALQGGRNRSRQQLSLAASLQNALYDPATGALFFRIQNQTGHKLLTGYPEGRRMFVNVKVFNGANLVYEINPYDAIIGTLKGQPDVASSPALGPNQRFDDRLVYEAKGSSSITGEAETFHFALTTDRYKDNRIPPLGFNAAGATARLADARYGGVATPDLFSTAEYQGGYDDVFVSGLPQGATSVEIKLYYQTTTREYIEFLRDEINGTGNTLKGNGVSGDPAYLVQTDPFFHNPVTGKGMRAWGDTIFALWDHNKDLPGAAPITMASATATLSAAPTTSRTFLPLVDRP